MPYRPEQAFERVTHGWIVIDDEYDGLVLTHAATPLAMGVEDRIVAQMAESRDVHRCGGTIAGRGDRPLSRDLVMKKQPAAAACSC